MPQRTDEHESGAVENEFGFGDLDLSALSVTSMDDASAGTGFVVPDSWPPSCCCAPN